MTVLLWHKYIRLCRPVSILCPHPTTNSYNVSQTTFVGVVVQVQRSTLMGDLFRYRSHIKADAKCHKVSLRPTRGKLVTSPPRMCVCVGNRHNTVQLPRARGLQQIAETFIGTPVVVQRQCIGWAFKRIEDDAKKLDTVGSWLKGKRSERDFVTAHTAIHFSYGIDCRVA